MNTFRLTLSTPDGNLLEREVAGLFLRGEAGDLAVLPGHIPFITTVKSGACRIELENGDELCGHTDGGILSVSANEVTLLSGSFRFDNFDKDSV